MKPIFAEPNDFVAADVRLMHAAKPHFAKVVKKPIKKLEERYPNTVALLFEAATKYVSDQDQNRINIETLPSEIIIQLIISLSKNRNIEIIDNERLKLSIPEIDMEGICQLFRDYVINLQIPSYSTVELLLENDQIQMATDQIAKFAHLHDKTKSLIKLIHYHLQKSHYQEAVDAFALLPPNMEKRDLISKIIHSLVSGKNSELAYSFCETLKDNLLRDHAFHEIALQLAIQGKFEESFSMVKKIIDKDEMEPYTLSILVSILVDQKKFDEACKLALSIHDRDYRQDAINTIVKKMVKFKKMDVLELFVENLDKIEKIEADKIIESGLKVHLQDERIKNLRLRL